MHAVLTHTLTCYVDMSACTHTVAIYIIYELSLVAALCLIFFSILTCDRALCRQLTQPVMVAMKPRSRDEFRIAIKLANSYISVDRSYTLEEADDHRILSSLKKIYVDGQPYEFCSGLHDEINRFLKELTLNSSKLAKFVTERRVKSIRSTQEFLFPESFQITQRPCHHAKSYTAFDQVKRKRQTSDSANNDGSGDSSLHEASHSVS